MALVGAILFCSVNGQVVVNLQLPAVGLTVKSQLWSMTLSSSSADVLTVKINMTMTDVATGQQVLSGATDNISLPQGNKVLQYADVVPVHYVVLNSSYPVDASQEGFLPIGNFNFCFEIQRLNHEVLESIAEECATIEVEPLSPPLLNSPTDQSESNELRPLFTWLPPVPVSLFNNLSYNFKLVELLPKQNSSAAIQQNFPLFFQQNIFNPNLIYPSSLPDLDTSKTYAWQIIANSNNLGVSASEIWTFKVKTFGTDSITYKRQPPYIKLKAESAEGYFICDGRLNLEYLNELNDSTVTVKMYDESKKGRKEIPLDEDFLLLTFGQNLINIDLSNTSGFISGHQYMVEITNSKNEVWKSRFEYKPLD